MVDRSNGYEAVSADFIRYRGNPATREAAIGMSQVRAWARRLSPGASVLDLGCGPGLPLTAALVEADLDVHAIDASPSHVAAFQLNFPGVPVACEAVEETNFFGKPFDAVLAWGLMFLLEELDQGALISRLGEVLVDGGRFLFTAPADPLEWNDAMTGLPSRSLGRARYHELLTGAGLTVVAEYQDEGRNHYFETVKSLL